MGGWKSSVREPETEGEIERETATRAEKKNKTEEATGIDGIAADTPT